jgi:hypothetical protein
MQADFRVQRQFLTNTVSVVLNVPLGVKLRSKRGDEICDRKSFLRNVQCETIILHIPI